MSTNQAPINSSRSQVSAGEELLSRLRVEHPSQPATAKASNNSGKLPEGGGGEQDTVLTTEAIGEWISREFFPCNARKASYLFERYGSRPGGPGFFKISGTVALSKSRFRAWYAAKTGGRS